MQILRDLEGSSNEQPDFVLTVEVTLLVVQWRGYAIYTSLMINHP
jgi:hypothetical protein